MEVKNTRGILARYSFGVNETARFVLIRGHHHVYKVGCRRLLLVRAYVVRCWDLIIYGLKGVTKENWYIKVPMSVVAGANCAGQTYRVGWSVYTYFWWGALPSGVSRLVVVSVGGGWGWGLFSGSVWSVCTSLIFTQRDASTQDCTPFTLYSCTSESIIL
jgi:hypothetical protein